MFDELAIGRRVKTLTVVDDCSKEIVQIAVDTSMPALYDNGPEFADRTMQTWAAKERCGAALHPAGQAVAKRLHRKL